MYIIFHQIMTKHYFEMWIGFFPMSIQYNLMTWLTIVKFNVIYLGHVFKNMFLNESNTLNNI
jgi:hypothetical protein